MERLATQQSRIGSSLSALATASHPLDPDDYHLAQDNFPALETALNEFAAQADLLPAQVTSITEQGITQVTIETGKVLGDLTGRWTKLEAGLASLVGSLTSHPAQFEAIAATYAQLLDNHDAQFANAQGELIGAIEAAQSSLESTITDQIQKTSELIQNTLSELARTAQEDLGQRTKGLVETAASTLTDSLGSLESLANLSGDQLESTARKIFDDLDEMLVQAIERKIPDAQRELIEHAVQALSEEIIKGIAMSTIGGQISVALSPYLVELIAVKKALDLILDAIEIYKNLTNPLGVFD